MTRLGRTLWASVAVAALLALAACGGAPTPEVIEGEVGSSESAVSTGDSCDVPKEGCSCETEGQTITCGHVVTRDGNLVICPDGNRTCTDGVWGKCVSSVTIYHGGGG